MIDIQVRRETGDIVAKGSRGIHWTVADRIDEERFPLLGSLLPYADAMFNARQTVRLRRELADEEIRTILGPQITAELDQLCLQVEQGSHLYLWFVGD